MPTKSRFQDAKQKVAEYEDLRRYSSILKLWNRPMTHRILEQSYGSSEELVKPKTFPFVYAQRDFQYCFLRPKGSSWNCLKYQIRRRLRLIRAHLAEVIQR